MLFSVWCGLHARPCAKPTEGSVCTATDRLWSPWFIIRNVAAGRVSRKVAASAVEELLRGVASQATRYARAVYRVSVFGSFARGALDVGDVDLLIEAALTDEIAPLQRAWDKESLECLLGGRQPPRRLDWRWHLAQGLSRRRVLQMHVNDLPSEGVTPLIVVWERGMGAEQALGRVRAIRADPTAGRFQEREVRGLEGVEPFYRRVAWDLLADLAAKDTIRVRRLELPRLIPCDQIRDRITRRLQSDTLRRAAIFAVAANLEPSVPDGYVLDYDAGYLFVERRWIGDEETGNAPCLCAVGGAQSRSLFDRLVRFFGLGAARIIEVPKAPTTGAFSAIEFTPGANLRDLASVASQR